MDGNILEKVKQRQIAVTKQWKHGDGDNITYEHDPSIAVIIDDVVEDEKQMKQNPIFSYYHCVSRHHKVLYIELFQYYSMLIPKYRRQLSYVFIMRPNSENDMKSMHREFFSMYTYNVFKEIVNTCTANRGCLVVSVLSQDENRVFYYKAEYPPKQFKVGTKYSRMMYR